MDFQLEIVICTNTESMRGLAEDACTCDWIPDDHEVAEQVWENKKDEYTDRLIRSAIEAIYPDFPDYTADGFFRHWNGGKYSHQAKLYGWTSIPCGVVRVVERDEDEDGGETRRKIDPADWTDEHRTAVAELESRIDAAIADETEDIRRDYAREIITDMAECLNALEG